VGKNCEDMKMCEQEKPAPYWRGFFNAYTIKNQNAAAPFLSFSICHKTKSDDSHHYIKKHAPAKMGLDHLKYSPRFLFYGKY